MSSERMVRVGTAGWSIPKQLGDTFPSQGSRLEKYAVVFTCTEINSSFHRVHRSATYERWAASVPPEFRFSLKVPKEITHKRKLIECGELLETFLAGSAMLCDKLGVYVVQLPPKLEFDRRVAGPFFARFRDAYAGGLACEPRHASWFAADASTLLQRYRITRVGADPALHDGAGKSDPYGGFAYFRWHGSPRTYYSAYDDSQLQAFARTVNSCGASDIWCIFDNTALDAATGNAMQFEQTWRISDDRRTVMRVSPVRGP